MIKSREKHESNGENLEGGSHFGPKPKDPQKFLKTTNEEKEGKNKRKG